MGGAGIRRALWAVVLFGWPAVVIIRTLMHPEWGADLSDGGASAQFLCGLVLITVRPRLLAAVRGRHSGAALLAQCVARLDAYDHAWSAIAGPGRSQAGPPGKRDLKLVQQEERDPRSRVS